MDHVQLRAFLRDLQKYPYTWPNRYLAWRKPDDTLFMIATRSLQFSTLLKYQYEPWCQNYNVHNVDINPSASHVRGNKEFDPVEEIISEVSNYKYLGSWDDPEFFMSTPSGDVASHGRWDLARANILSPQRKPTLSSQILSATSRASSEHGSTPTEKER